MKTCCPKKGLWRKLDGVDVFTGVVKMGDLCFKKLDDPNGCLCGPGHDMHPPEFLSLMSLYDGSENIRFQKPVDACLFPNKHFDFDTSDWESIDKYMEKLGEPDYPALHFSRTTPPRCGPMI